MKSHLIFTIGYAHPVGLNICWCIRITISTPFHSGSLLFLSFHGPFFLFIIPTHPYVDLFYVLIHMESYIHSFTTKNSPWVHYFYARLPRTHDELLDSGFYIPLVRWHINPWQRKFIISISTQTAVLPHLFLKHKECTLLFLTIMLIADRAGDYVPPKTFVLCVFDKLDC